MAASDSRKPSCEAGLRGSLLVVEDDAPLRQMLSWELADLGYAIGTAGGCAEARRLAAQQRFDFALIDVRLPDGDGRDLAAELVDSIPPLDVILMSGAHIAREPPPTRRRVLAFLAKPVDVGDIHRLLQTAAGLFGQDASLSLARSG